MSSPGSRLFPSRASGRLCEQKFKTPALGLMTPAREEREEARRRTSAVQIRNSDNVLPHVGLVCYRIIDLIRYMSLRDILEIVLSSTET